MDFSGAHEPDAPALEGLSDQEALENTEILIDIRESAQAYGLAWWVDGNFENSENYLYKPEGKKRLIRAWSRVIGRYRVKVSPWLDVIFAEMTTTAPLISVAFQARKYRLQLEALKKQMAAQKQTGEAAPTPQTARTDAKNQWKVDENGYFEYNPASTYIKKADRTEKPEMTPENYKMLVKHNGKDYIEKIFGIEGGQNG